MSDFSTGLTLAETERLALLLEEMGEAQQAIGKILRHGYESVNPDLPPPAGDTNRANLEREIADVLVAIDMMIDGGDIEQWLLDDRKRVKAHKVRQWLHHQK
jgi:NTP pyrophosphatase (non-canonical NTP hydrolase)